MGASMCPNMLKDNIVRNRKRFVSGKENWKEIKQEILLIYKKFTLKFTWNLLSDYSPIKSHAGSNL